MRILYLPAVCLCLIAAGCGKQESPAPASATANTPAPGALSIDRLEPSFTAEGKAFHPRPDGQSVLVVMGTGIPAGATVLWNDQPMVSSGGGGFVQGVIPANLVQKAGTAKITVRSGDVVSNPLDFAILATTGPAPDISAVSPTGAVAGKGFNVQPTGDSALGLAGTGFLPGISVMIDGRKMNTVFGSPVFISAAIPGSLVASPGSHQIQVVNADGKTSNKIAFNVAAP